MPFFLTSLMEVSCLMSSYCFCNAQLFITNPNPNPNPETAFFQKSDKPQPRQHVLLTPIWICAFLHAYSPHPTPLPIPTLPCFWAFALWSTWKCLLFSASYHYVSCNKYLPFQLCSSWKVLSPWRGDILFFICTQPPTPPSPHSLPPSLPQGEFLKSGAKILLGPFGPAFFWHPFEIAFILLRNIYLRTKDSDEIIPPFALLSPNLQYRRSAWISSFRTENFLKIIGIDGVNRRFATKQYVAPKKRTMLREQPIS